MEETLKITFEIGGEKIIIETDATSIDSSIEKVKKIGKFILKDAKSSPKATEQAVETPVRRGRKPGPKKLSAETSAGAVTERKKPGPKPGSKRKTSATAKAKKTSRSSLKENAETALVESL